MTQAELDTMAGGFLYGWEESRDIDRYATVDRAIMQEYFPHLLRAWDNYLAAKRCVDLEVKNLNP